MPAELQVHLIAGTAVDLGKLMGITGDKWSPDFDKDTEVSQGEILAEWSGRACYASWNKPNPDRQDNESYLGHILEVKHYSVLRHAVFTFYFEGISRSCSHELIRHHIGIDYSQLSQRYVDAEKMDYVIPPAMRGDLDLEDRLSRSWSEALEDYRQSVLRLEEQALSRKQAREAARAFLPGCTETKIVVTGNLQAWRNFLEQRGTEAADAEIRELAVAVAKVLKENAPNAFQDMMIHEALSDIDGSAYEVVLFR